MVLYTPPLWKWKTLRMKNWKHSQFIFKKKKDFEDEIEKIENFGGILKVQLWRWNGIGRGISQRKTMGKYFKILIESHRLHNTHIDHMNLIIWILRSKFIWIQPLKWNKFICFVSSFTFSLGDSRFTQRVSDFCNLFSSA